MRQNTLARPDNARRRALRGGSTAEFAAATFVMTMVFFGATGMTAMALRATDKNATEAGLTGGSRRAMEESLFQLRSANTVLASSVLAESTYSTSAQQVVVAAPGYDPASSEFFLDGITDYVALWYDSEAQELRETLVPGTGSVRPARTDVVLAKNVASCTFAYRVREQFRSTESGSAKFTLNATPNGTPVVYVNGAQTSGTYNSSNNTLTVTLGGKQGNNATQSSDVQVVYTVSPNAGASTLAMVAEVDVTMRFAEKDSRQVTRSTTLSGAARLRNARK